MIVLLLNWKTMLLYFVAIKSLNFLIFLISYGRWDVVANYLNIIKGDRDSKKFKKHYIYSLLKYIEQFNDTFKFLFFF